MRKVSKTSFFEAVRNWKSDDVTTAIQRRPDFVSLRDSAERTALHICSRREALTATEIEACLATARVLVKGGADINAVQLIEDDGEVFPATPLWYAVARGHNRQLVFYFLEQKADPNNCMFAMVFADDLPSAKLLRRHGARIDDVFSGETPLIYAVRQGRAGFIEWLLTQGADPNFRDRRGLTALHHAVRRRLPDSTLRLLVEHGANVHAVSNEGIPVTQLATRLQRQVLGIAVLPKQISG